jgi:DNA-binding HxlR family transcriptional regulator
MRRESSWIGAEAEQPHTPLFGCFHRPVHIVQKPGKTSLDFVMRRGKQLNHVLSAFLLHKRGDSCLFQVIDKLISIVFYIALRIESDVFSLKPNEPSVLLTHRSKWHGKLFILVCILKDTMDENTFFDLAHLVGQKWVLPIISLLFFDQLRFSMMKKQLRITSRTLSRKLKNLENCGLIERMLDDAGNSVYRLTDEGHKLFCALRDLMV